MFVFIYQSPTWSQSDWTSCLGNKCSARCWPPASNGDHPKSQIPGTFILPQKICANYVSNYQEPLSRIPATQPIYLQRALRQFSLWLSGLEVVHSPRLVHLTVQKLHGSIHHDALARLAVAYRMICEEVKNPANKYEAAATLLGSERPFGQVHLLWQIFGLEGGAGDDDGAESDEEEDENEDDEEDEEDESSESQ